MTLAEKLDKILIKGGAWKTIAFIQKIKYFSYEIRECLFDLMLPSPVI